MLILVGDVNDNVPTFTGDPMVYGIPKNAPLGYTIARIEVSVYLLPVTQLLHF